FFFNAPSTTDIYTLSLHDALPIYPETEELHRGEAVHVEAPYLGSPCVLDAVANEEGESDRHQEKLEQSSAPFAHRPPHDSLEQEDRKSTRLNSSHVAISYAVFCLK